MSRPKLHIKTFGCQMNEYDSAKLARLMQTTLGFGVTDEAAAADLVILNTCSVREKAQEKLFSELGSLRKLQQQKPHLVIAVGGCVAAQEKEHIIKRAPYVALIFGPQTWQRLPAMYSAFLTSNRHTKIVDTDFCATEKFSCLANLTHHTPAPPSSTAIAAPATAYVTIMEGCNKFCSYCIVPYTRGREISRPFDEIMREVHALVNQGVKEIYFLGQNVNNYSDSNGANLATLIRVTAQIPEVARVRFITSHPAHFSNELSALYAHEPKLAAHLHLPVQSGSNRILKAMRRNYTHEEYREIVAKLRHVRPDVSISSDFIVGFPGETEEEFAATLELIEDVGFDHSFSFIYSPRPGTQAAKLADNVPLSTKKQRLQTLQQALNSATSKISNAMVNTPQKIIVTALSKKSQAQAEQHQETEPHNIEQLMGRTENNRVVNFYGTPDLIGKVVTVKITKVLSNSLDGDIIY